ncbi:hypothetical protein ACIG63_47305, partial [Streptomyces antimycoticus]
MRQSTFVDSSITTRSGDAKVHGRILPMAPIELVELLLGASQADLETFDLAEPTFRLARRLRQRCRQRAPRGGVRSRPVAHRLADTSA